MAAPENFNNLCRTCAAATQSDSRQYIFEGEGILHDIPLKLKSLPVEVNQSDQLPKVMCEECVYKLNILHDFIEKIKSTETQLNNMLRYQATIIKVEPDICVYEHDADNGHPSNDCDFISIQSQEDLKEEDAMDAGFGTHFLDPQCSKKISGSDNNQNFKNDSNTYQDLNLTPRDQQNINTVYTTSKNSTSTQIQSNEQELYIENSLPDTITTSNFSNQVTNEADLNQSPMFYLCRFCRLPFPSHDAANFHIVQVHKGEQNNRNVDQNLECGDQKINSLPDGQSALPTVPSSKQCSIQTTAPIISKPSCSKIEKRSRSKSDYVSPFYACTSCYIVFPTNEALTLHTKDHKPLPECKVCGIRFNSDIKLADHMRKDKHVFSPQENKVWKCSECGKECRKKCKIQNHIRVHTGERPFICNFCPKAFPIKAQLTMHERKHKNDWCYICNYCGKGFYVKVYFDNHVRTTHTKEKPFKCDKCDASYASKASLKEHILSKHNDGSIPIRIYECKVCGKKFKDNNSLYYHNKTHAASLEERRKHKCLVCGASFVKNHYLRKHMKIHTGESIEKFECHLCGKKLATSHGLELHLVIHSGVKNFICDFCGKAFASESTLKTHIRCHTGEKPYQCRVCSNYFTQRSSLLSHLKNIHSIDDRVRKIKFNS